MVCPGYKYVAPIDLPSTTTMNTFFTDSMIDFGFVVAAFVPLVLLWIFGMNHLRAVWRVSLGLGIIPALAVLVWRLRA